MTYLRKPRKAQKTKPPAPSEIRCRSAVNIADDATVTAKIHSAPPAAAHKEKNKS